MERMNEVQRKLCLMNEVETSIRFLSKGLGEIQKLSENHDFYDAPISSFSFGLEKLLKSLIVIKHWDNPSELKKLHDHEWTGKRGHDLTKLLNKIIQICEENNYSSKFPAAKTDITFITKNSEIKMLISTLSDFSQGGRFYNLDAMMLGYSSERINPADGWRKIEDSILFNREDLKMKFYNNLYSSAIKDEIIHEIICVLERFLRSICRLFTLADFGDLAKQVSPNVFVFLMLRDDEIGIKKYY